MVSPAQRRIVEALYDYVFRMQITVVLTQLMHTLHAFRQRVKQMGRSEWSQSFAGLARQKKRQQLTFHVLGYQK